MRSELFQFLAICFLALGLAGCSTLNPASYGYPLAASLVRCEKSDEVGTSIVGGKTVDKGDPDQHLVTMLKINRDGRKHICTGALISDRVILTAAHCVAGLSNSNVEAQFVTKEGCPVYHQQTIDREIDRVLIHEEFDGTPTSFADLALILLKDKAPDDQLRLPILTKETKLTNDTITLLGFGITGEAQRDSQTLRRVTKSFATDFIDEGRKFWVNQSSGSGGFCRGDSGAPLIGEVWGEPYVLGVNSANIGLKPGVECQTASIAMSALHFGDWIHSRQGELENRPWWKKTLSLVSSL